MNLKTSKIIIFLISLIFVLNSCKQGSLATKASKKFKHNTPLIKEDVKKIGQKEIDKTLEMGPQPVEADIIKLQKRKKISSVKEKNYLLIPEEAMMLKQKITFNPIKVLYLDKTSPIV